MAGLLANMLLGAAEAGGRAIHSDWKDRIRRSRDEAFRKEGWEHDEKVRKEDREYQEKVRADDRSYQDKVRAEQNEFSNQQQANNQAFNLSLSDKNFANAKDLATLNSSLKLDEAKGIQALQNDSQKQFALTPDGKVAPLSQDETGNLNGIPLVQQDKNSGRMEFLFSPGRSASGLLSSSKKAASSNNKPHSVILDNGTEGSIINQGGQWMLLKQSEEGQPYFTPIQSRDPSQLNPAKVAEHIQKLNDGEIQPERFAAVYGQQLLEQVYIPPKNEDQDTSMDWVSLLNFFSESPSAGKEDMIRQLLEQKNSQ
ncbi:hypothetical protein KCM76_22930 [Zooshikella marina]|uniref:hypothetical protein n=1 Tax=Zooshikella ganghwensis TaxID=202772 RepID=UPI001BAEE803|nr:hypothetical protein [Zooshikella ganghwensis]MBU2708867.1 hypothetical protein [Zooshikella ganghwensis]